jgi:hypothetical protein
VQKLFVLFISNAVLWPNFVFFDFPRRILQLFYSIGGLQGSVFGSPNLILLKPKHDVADIRLGGDKSLFPFTSTISDSPQCLALFCEFE